MKIILTCNDAIALKAEIIKAVEKDTLKTWETRTAANNEKVLTHSTANHQWTDEVLIVLEPHQNAYTTDTLDAKISWWNGKVIPTSEVQAYVIGRFTEVLLAHFSSKFSDFKIEK